MSVAWLLERMQQWHNQPAIVWHDQAFSYGELLQRVDQARLALEAGGISAGSVVTLEGDYSPNACALLLALIERGAIIVPLTDSVATQREDFLQIAEVQVSIQLSDQDVWQFDYLDVSLAFCRVDGYQHRSDRSHHHHEKR